jgi:hypothetical protein
LVHPTEGFNVMLQAVPLHDNGKIVPREHEQEEHDEDERDGRGMVRSAAFCRCALSCESARGPDADRRS